MADDDQAKREQVLSEAKKRVGVPYRLSPPPDGVNNLDCSLYVLVTFRDAGLPFPPAIRTAEEIRQACDHIDDWSTVLLGDLLFFEHTYEPGVDPAPDGHLATHIGISLGAGTRLMWDSHASTSPARPDGVGETNIGTDYWQQHIFEARHPRQYAAAPTGPVTPIEALAYHAIDSGVRLRALPGTEQAILVDDLGANATLTALPDPIVEADGHRWRKVQTQDGTVGWVAAEFIRRADPGAELTDEPDHTFTFAELWPKIQSAAGQFGADPRVLAAIIAQESSFTNWRVHVDGTGHGLIGLDDHGLLSDFEAWSGLSCGRGQNASSIPPGLQIEYLARTLAADTRTYGSAINAARVWHRGPSLWKDADGDFYEARIGAHLRELFG